MFEFLGVVQSLQPESFGQDHRGGDHGTGQRSPSRLINPGDRLDPPGMKLLFMLQIGKKRRASGFPEALL